MQANERLTTRDYWVEYYSEASSSPEIIHKTVGRYDAFWDRMVKSLGYEPTTIMEVGAFPGRYLAYLARKYNVRPTGIDFNPESERFSHTMYAMGVTDFSYVIGDFLTIKGDCQFDLVISNGFIEHFDDYARVMDLHVDHLKPGGAMVIMVPNKRFLRYLYGRFLDSENLRLHNLSAMRKRVFRDFAVRNKLQLIELRYFGGFPYKVHQPLVGFKWFVHVVAVKVFRILNPLLARFPCRMWSSALIAVYKKTTDK